MVNINFVNELSTSVRVINKADVEKNSTSAPHTRLRLIPGDWLIIEILGEVTLPKGCFIKLHKDFNYEFSPGNPPGFDPTAVEDNVRTLKTGPHEPEWTLKITNPGIGFMEGSLKNIIEENVTVGENQTLRSVNSLTTRK